jgi:hypothetical protein
MESEGNKGKNANLINKGFKVLLMEKGYTYQYLASNTHTMFCHIY